MTGKSSGKARSRKAATGKPQKPYPEFPLGAANNGCWQKKINGSLYYFGRWGRTVNGKMELIREDGNWQEALAIYKAQVDTIRSTGRAPRTDQSHALTVADLCNRFLTAKLRKLRSREIAPRTFSSYREVTDILIAHFGKSCVVDDLTAGDFGTLRAKLAERWGPVRLGCEIVRIKTVFKFGTENGLIEKAIRYGSEFNKPAKAVLRKHRASKGERTMTAADIRALLAKASPQLKAMTLLGVNGGFGNADVANLPLSAVDLEAGWITYPRPKTGVRRECPLWPETVAALRQAIAERPAPSEDADAGLVFLTKYGNRWVRSVVKEETEKGPKHVPIDSVGLEFGKLLDDLKLTRKGLGFYALRHTFRTIADAARDQPAAREIMGHADDSMDDAYRERIEPTRLKAVTDYVRNWLFGDATKTTGKAGRAKPKAKRPAKSKTTKPADSGDGRPQLRIVG